MSVQDLGAVQSFQTTFCGLVYTSILLGVKVPHLLQAGQCQKKTWDLKWQLRQRYMTLRWVGGR